MGFSREIVVHQNPYFKKSQVNLLYTSLVNKYLHPFDLNGYVHFRLANQEIQSLPADDVGIAKQDEAVKMAEQSNIPISIQFTHKENQRNVTLIQNNNQYRFWLEIRTKDDQYKLFEEFHKEIIDSIPSEFHLNRIDWVSNYNEEIIRCETDMNHEGVLILASHKNLKKYYENNDFNSDFPSGISELLKERIVIAIECKDYDFKTTLEKEKISEWLFGYIAAIQFEENDELLLLHHGDFTMICDNHNGDYKSYGRKHLISISIEEPRVQTIQISKPKDKEDRRLILQFVPTEIRYNHNKLLEYESIPTHNNR